MIRSALLPLSALLAPPAHLSPIARRCAAVAMLGLSSFTLFACDQAAPPGSSVDSMDGAMDSTDSGDTMNTSDTADGGSASGSGADTAGTTSGSNSELDSYFPLVDGGHWEYVARTTGGQVLGTEVVDATALTYMGQEAFLFEDNPNQNGEWTQSWISRQGTSARRIHKEIKDATGLSMIVDYDPGFTRVDDAWTSTGVIGEIMYERTETDGLGLNPKVEMRGHSFEVTGVDQSITVPAGSFNCIAVERIRTTGLSAGEVVHFWYAPGVGKVKEERPANNRVEELTAVHIPDGVSYP